MGKLNNYLFKCNYIVHTTLDPKGPGVIRIHLIPPKKAKPGIAWVAILNGYHVIPLQTGWAILLKEFMEELNRFDSVELEKSDVDALVKLVVKKVKLIFTDATEEDLASDLAEIIKAFEDICDGKEPDSNIGLMTLAEYSKYMSGPHRMDLLVSAMEKDNKWNCNQKCVFCYACGQKLANDKELSTKEWKNIIDNCKKANIPSLTFTGGEPTMRDDLVELISYSKWFVTRLNTNGINLTSKLCNELAEASLDSVQVTLYSYDEEIHNKLVGANKFKETIEGIKNAISAGLDVSINTPLCELNKDYEKTVEFAHTLGVRYFSSSGLIPTGNALGDSRRLKLTNDEILEVVKKAYSYTSKNGCELAFTSPGWIDEDELLKMHIVPPSCGACLSNMAINPSGDVIPCQSWLSSDPLGNMLNDSWKKIWESRKCKEIRKHAKTEKDVCLLKKGC